MNTLPAFFTDVFGSFKQSIEIFWISSSLTFCCSPCLLRFFHNQHCLLAKPIYNQWSCAAYANFHHLKIWRFD